MIAEESTTMRQQLFFFKLSGIHPVCPVTLTITFSGSFLTTLTFFFKMDLGFSVFFYKTVLSELSINTSESSCFRFQGFTSEFKTCNIWILGDCNHTDTDKPIIKELSPKNWISRNRSYTKGNVSICCNYVEGNQEC